MKLESILLNRTPPSHADTPRSAAEELFGVLLRGQPTAEPTTALVVRMLSEHLRAFPPSQPDPAPGSPEFEAVLCKEAVYQVGSHWSNFMGFKRWTATIHLLNVEYFS